MNDHKNNRSNLDVNMNFTDNDKEEICNIIKSMSKEHHMYIYFNILHNFEKPDKEFIKNKECKI